MRIVAPRAALLAAIAFSLCMARVSAETTGEPPAPGDGGTGEVGTTGRVEGKVAPPKQDQGKAGTPAATVPRPQVEYIPPLQSRAPRSEPPMMGVEFPAGIKLGNVLLHPMMEERMTYTDNVLGGPFHHRREDYLWVTKPGLEMLYTPRPNLSVLATYSFGWNDYLMDNAHDYLTHDALLLTDWKSTSIKDLEVIFRDQYSQSGNTSVLEDEFVSFTRVQSNKLGPTVKWKTGPSALEFGYEFGFVDYFKRINQQFDYHSHTADALYSYKLSDQLIPYARYELQGVRFANVETGDFNRHYADIGVKAALPKFRFDASVGYHAAKVWNPGDFDEGPAAKLRIEYAHSPRYTAYFTGLHQFTYGPRAQASRDTEFEAGGRFVVTPRFRVDARIDWLQADREVGYIERTWTLHAGFDYRIIRELHSYVGYDYADRTFSQGKGVIINCGSAGLNFRF